MSVLRWARYLRVSSEEQALPGTSSISTQDSDTASLIAREGGVLVDTYCDDRRYRVGGRLVEPSGERTDRPEWQRLLAVLLGFWLGRVLVLRLTRPPSPKADPGSEVRHAP